MMEAGARLRRVAPRVPQPTLRSRTAWMITAPMLADFAIRLAFGLAVSLLLTSWRTVPLGFFRTQAQVILGLLVLAALDQARAGGPAWALWALVAAAVMAYFSAIMWGLGLPRFGAIASLLVVLITAVWLGVASESASALFWLHGGASRLASGFLLGSTLTAMLLGHHYLTAPAMSIEPLKRIVELMAWALAARCVLAAMGIWLAPQGTIGGLVESTLDTQTSVFLAARWGMGFVGGGRRDLHDLEDRADPVDAISDGHPLHRHDLRPFRRAHRDDHGRPGRPMY